MAIHFHIFSHYSGYIFQILLEVRLEPLIYVSLFLEKQRDVVMKASSRKSWLICPTSTCGTWRVELRVDLETRRVVHRKNTGVSIYKLICLLWQLVASGKAASPLACEGALLEPCVDHLPFVSLQRISQWQAFEIFDLLSAVPYVCDTDLLRKILKPGHAPFHDNKESERRWIPLTQWADSADVRIWKTTATTLNTTVCPTNVNRKFHSEIIRTINRWFRGAMPVYHLTPS